MNNPKAYKGKGKYIFVSYSHKDSKEVLPFISALQKQYNVWFDEGIHFGKEWADEIAKKLLDCELFIFMISENSFSSSNCKDEIHLAREKGKNFINVLIKETEFPDSFMLRYSRYQTCNLYRYNDIDSAIEDINSKCDYLSECVKDKAVDEEVKQNQTNVIKNESKKEDKNESKHKFNLFKDVLLKDVFNFIFMLIQITLMLLFIFFSYGMHYSFPLVSFGFALICSIFEILIYTDKVNDKVKLVFRVLIVAITIVILILFIGGVSNRYLPYK